MGPARSARPPGPGAHGLRHPDVERPALRPPQLVELPARPGGAAARRRGGEPDRPLHRRTHRRRRHHALGAGRQGDADPSRQLRRHGPAADSLRNRCVRGRRLARGLHQGRRPPAGLVPLRRALRPPLDGPRPLRRHAWQRRRPGHPAVLALPRLSDSRLQRRRALRPLRQGACRGRPAARPAHQSGGGAERVRDRHRALPDGRARLPAGRHGRRAGAQRGQPDRRHLEGLPRAHGLVLPLPRSQVRRHQSGGLLRLLRHPRLQPSGTGHHRIRRAPQRRPRAALHP